MRRARSRRRGGSLGSGVPLPAAPHGRVLVRKSALLREAVRSKQLIHRESVSRPPALAGVTGNLREKTAVVVRRGLRVDRVLRRLNEHKRLYFI